MSSSAYMGEEYQVAGKHAGTHAMYGKHPVFLVH